jgi:hypothetical protein
MLKKAGSMAQYLNGKATRLAVNEGGDGRLYITNSYGLGVITETNPLGQLFAAYNIKPEPGYYIADTGITPEGLGAEPLSLKSLTEGAKKDNPIERTLLAGKPAFVDSGKAKNAGGLLAVFGEGPHVLARQELISVYIEGEPAVWTSDGPRKPLVAWDSEARILGMIMPVLA